MTKRSVVACLRLYHSHTKKSFSEEKTIKAPLWPAETSVAMGTSQDAPTKAPLKYLPCLRERRAQNNSSKWRQTQRCIDSYDISRIAWHVCDDHIRMSSFLSEMGQKLEADKELKDDCKPSILHSIDLGSAHSD